MAPREGAEGARRAAPGAGGERVGTREGSRAAEPPPCAVRLVPAAGRRAQTLPLAGLAGVSGRGPGTPLHALHPCGMGRPPTCAREGASWIAEKGRSPSVPFLWRSLCRQRSPLIITPESWGPLPFLFQGGEMGTGEVAWVRQICGLLSVQRELKHGWRHHPSTVF